MAIIESHGFLFDVEGTGFVHLHAELDRDLGVEAIQDVLNEMSFSAVEALHKADMAFYEEDIGERSPVIEQLENIGLAAATRDWYSVGDAFFTVSAIPATKKPR